MSIVSTSSEIRVEPWPTEVPLFVLAVLASAALWVLAIVTVIGLIYGLMIAVFLFIIHVIFVAHLRGNGVRVGPDQFPEIHASVEHLATRMGMKRVPETYLIQGGGVLNAMATRFAGSDIIVLFSDLIEACDDDHEARDMIIGHELGHLHRGHLRWQFAIAPAMVVPFLSGTLSRAREYTCDRYGAAAAGSSDGAVLGLSILAAGGRLGRRIDRRALITQRTALNTGWMTLAEWLSTHPPLVKRIAHIDPSLREPSFDSRKGVVRALGIIGMAFAPVFIAGIVAAIAFPSWIARHAPAAPQRTSSTTPTFQPPAREVGMAQARKDFVSLAALIRDEERAGRGLPWDTRDLYERWNRLYGKANEPRDPFDGTRYAYEQRGKEFRLWSVGPDGEWDTPDDVTYDSRTAAVE
jgi:Zn-dependent protease with chaperone function